MSGRTLVPLTFKDGEREIVVRTSGALKEVFKKEFYTQLVAYLHNKRLERFFFALGMDEIKETIENLRNSGKSDLEVINKVAELIGAEPISVELSEGVCIARHQDLSKELKDTDQEIILTGSKYFLEGRDEIELKGSKVFRGNGATELTISVSTLKGTGKLVFENITLVIKNAVFLEDTVFEGFEKIQFKNVKLKIDVYSFSYTIIDNKGKYPGCISLFFKLVNTGAEFSECDIVGCLHLEKAKLNVERSEFHDSTESVIVSMQSSIVLKDCKIVKNKCNSKYEAQVWLSGSTAELSNCEIAESDGAGVFSKSSKVSLINCKVYGNKSEGIRAEESSYLQVEGCDIYRNGGGLEPQISVDGSRALIKDSRIYDCKTLGVLGTNSEVSVIGCEIYGNEMHAILTEEKTNLKIEGCNIYKNSMEDYAQIYLEDTTAIVKNSQMHHSIGKRASCFFMSNSEVHVEGCEIYENLGGISAKKKSKLNIENCNFYKNDISLYLSNSKASITGCKIYKNTEHGIRIDTKSRAIIQDCDIYENGEYGYSQIHAEDSDVVLKNLQIHDGGGHGIITLSSNVSMTGCKIYNNGQNGIVADKKTSLNIQDCDIYENGTPEHLQDYSEKNFTEEEREDFERIQDGDEENFTKEEEQENSVLDGIGLLVINSKANVIGCNIYRNEYSGIFAQEKSEISVERCDIYENCSSEHPQVAVLSSTAVIKNSLIHDSEEGNGLSISDSKVSLIGCKIYQNNANGIWVVEKAKLNMENSIVYRNSNDETGKPQVHIEDSIAVIESSGVHESLGHSYGICLDNGAVLLYKVETSGNQYGVYVENGSVAIHECSIEDGIFN